MSYLRPCKFLQNRPKKLILDGARMEQRLKSQYALVKAWYWDIHTNRLTYSSYKTIVNLDNDGRYLDMQRERESILQERKISLSRYSHLFIFIAISITALIYLPTIFFDYVWDDLNFFAQINYHSYENWFYKSISEPFFVSVNYYRPIVVASFVSEIILFDGNPFISHLINYCLLLICTFLIYLVLSRELKIDCIHRKHLIATIGALCFSIHPALTENVAWISGRFDLLMTTFLIAALYANTFTERENVRAFLIGLLFLLAALCKEMAVAFAIVLPFIHAIQNSTNNPFKIWLERKNLKIYLAVIIAGLVYLLIRYSFLGYIYTTSIDPGTIQTDFTEGPFEQLLLSFKAIYFYTRQLFFPFVDMKALYVTELPIQLKDKWVIYGILISLVLITSILTSKLRFKAFIIANFLAFLPVLHFIPMTISDNIGHNRFIIFPLAVFLVSFAKYISLNKKWLTPTRIKIYFTSLLIWLLLSVMTTISVIPLWKSNLFFWQWNYEHTKNATTVTLYSQELMQAGDYELAEQVLTAYTLSANELKYDFQSSYYTLLGRLYENIGRIDLAEEFFTLSINETQTKGNLARVLTSLATIKIQKGNFSEVEELLQLAIQLDKIYSPAYEAYAIYSVKALKPVKQAKFFAKKSLEYSVNSQHYREIKARLEKYNLP